MRYFLLIITLLNIQLLHAQQQINVMFYNLENLFDTQIDSINKNKEYLPSSEKKWDEFKYRQKINQLAKVITSSCKNSPDFIGVCEIENEKVLYDLCTHPLLKKHKYEIIHFESADVRGIDVGFLYKKSQFNLLAFKKIKIPQKKELPETFYW